MIAAQLIKHKTGKTGKSLANSECRDMHAFGHPKLNALTAAIVMLTGMAPVLASDKPSSLANNVFLGAKAPLSGQRLSSWLVQQPYVEGAYFPGLSWLVPSEMPQQASLKEALQTHLMGSQWTFKAEAAARQRLSTWIRSLPVTGRVPVSTPDAHLLEVNPMQDPVLAPDHQIHVPLRPATVVVIRNNGQRCTVPHQPGREAYAYVQACEISSVRPIATKRSEHVDRVWIAQPDGKTRSVGIAGWNAQAQDEIAPGAWIWAPARDGGWDDKFSQNLIEFLATQGASGDPGNPSGSEQVLKGTIFTPASMPMRDLALTANDWGGIGLIQNPSARMAEAGELSVGLTRAYPYTRLNVTLQPLDWFELTYRYTSISDVFYGPVALSGTQSTKDKSVDVKVRLRKESATWPELAIGARDIGGTGNFAGEYLVASKRTGNFDWTLGLGWGSLGAKATLGNPLGFISNKFNTRGGVIAGGGQFNVNSFFRGRTSPFAGVQIQSPWSSLLFKAEYDGNDYRYNAPFTIPKPKSPFNLGAVYRYSPNTDISFGVQRGNVITAGVSLHFPASRLYTPKVSDTPLPPFVAERPANSNWASTSTDIGIQTGWKVAQILKQGPVLKVELDDAEGVYWQDMLDKASAILHRDAPSDVDEFHFVYINRGVVLAKHVVVRDLWAKQKTRPILPSELAGETRPPIYYPPANASIPKADAAKPVEPVNIYRSKSSPVKGELGFAFSQSLGGPDGFILYQASIEAKGEWKLGKSTWASGLVNLRALDNYKNFKYTAPSNLPRVRTFVREYLTSERVTMPNLQLTHMGQLNSNQYFSVYGGYLESMYGGVGAEWLYRPMNGRLALGVDANAVKQRNFDQRFGFRDYRTYTGHATAYFDTGWNDVIAKVSVGQYLAKDKGATLDLSRRFSNGVIFGAFATKTNVSAAQFGEGSFDKGIYFTIPLSALSTRSTPELATFMWNPLTRDGGAKLNRAYPLYEMTKVRDPRALSTEIPPPP